MIDLYDVGQVLSEIGPTVTKTPADSAKLAGLLPEWWEDDAVGDWVGQLAGIADENQVPPVPEVLAGLILGMATGVILGRQEAAELLDSTDDLEVVEGEDWVPHND